MTTVGPLPGDGRVGRCARADETKATANKLKIVKRSNGEVFMVGTFFMEKTNHL